MANSHSGTDPILDVLLAIYSLNAPERFWERLFRGLTPLVPFDLAGVGIGRNSRISTAIEYPPRGLSPTAVRSFNEYVSSDPVFSQVLSPTAPALRVSAVLSRRELHRTQLYRDLLEPLDLEDQIMMPLVASRAELVGIGLLREKPFTDWECAILTRLKPHLVQARRNAEAWRLARGQDDPAHARSPQPQFGVIEADLPRRHIVSMDSVAEAILSANWPRAASARAVLVEVLAGLENDRLHLPSTLKSFAPSMLRGRNGLVSVHVASIGGIDQPAVLVIGGRTPVERSRAGARLGLTRRESEVLHWVAKGHSNAEIAIILACSPATVKKHIERIFERLGVESRTAAARRWIDAGNGL